MHVFLPYQPCHHHQVSKCNQAVHQLLQNEFDQEEFSNRQLNVIHILVWNKFNKTKLLYDCEIIVQNAKNKTHVTDPIVQPVFHF